ncbi:MAG TPA: diacylglycerol kinase family protein [Aquihabitans sp.]|nr:diacylglycerol kinase family protein [Aquihabitans sp.]
MRFVALVNGAAGSVSDDVVSQIEDALAAAGAEVAVRTVEPADLAGAVRAAWRDHRPTAVLVAGGDGTVSSAAAAAAGTEVVLGVLPLGTFNHFARDLGMSVDLGIAARELVEGAVRAVDVGEVNGRVFVNNSVLGLYPDLVSVRDELRERRGWGKVRAVPVAAARILRRFTVHRLDLDGPGVHRAKVRTPLVFVGNGRFDTGGLGLPDRRGSALGDGVLDVVVARDVSRWGLVRTAARALFGREGGPGGDLDRAEVTELSVGSRARQVRVALDGEVVDLATPLRYRVRPGELRVLAPFAP